MHSPEDVFAAIKEWEKAPHQSSLKTFLKKKFTSMSRDDFQKILSENRCPPGTK